MPKALIVDSVNSSELQELTGTLGYETFLLATRQLRRPPRPSILSALRRTRSLKQTRMERWITAHVDTIQPDVVLTFTDNNYAFHRTARYFPGTPFIAIQNGQRWPFRNIGIPNQSNLSSHYLCMGQNDVEYLQSASIHFASIHVSGSLRSALEIRKNGPQRPVSDICLVSTWNPGSRDVFSHGFRNLVSWLGQYTRQARSLKVSVASRSSSKAGEIKEERRFVSDVLPKDWAWLSRTYAREVYHWCDDSSLVIGAGSTLCREVVGRGKPSISFLTEWKTNTTLGLSNEYSPNTYAEFCRVLEIALASYSGSSATMDPSACAPSSVTGFAAQIRSICGN